MPITHALPEMCARHDALVFADISALSPAAQSTQVRLYPLANSAQLTLLLNADGTLSARLQRPDQPSEEPPLELSVTLPPELAQAFKDGGLPVAQAYCADTYVTLERSLYDVPRSVSIHQRGVGGGCVGSKSPVPEDDQPRLAMTQAEIYQAMIDCTALFLVPTAEKRGAQFGGAQSVHKSSACLFTGVDGQPKLLSALHAGSQAVASAQQTTASINGQTLELESAAQTSTNYDACVHALSSAYTGAILPLGDVAALQLGDEVYLCGIPFDEQEPHVHRGRISAFEKEADGQIFALKIDATAVKGMSGGPIVCVQNGVPVLVGMIAAESFAPRDRFSEAQAALQTQHDDAEIILEADESEQEDLAGFLCEIMGLSSTGMASIERKNFSQPGLASIGYERAHFSAIWQALLEDGLVAEAGAVPPQAITPERLRATLDKVADLPNPVAIILRFLREQTEFRESQRLAIAAQRHIEPAYVLSLRAALMDQQVLTPTGKIQQEKVSEEAVKTALSSVQLELLLSVLQPNQQAKTPIKKEQMPSSDRAQEAQASTSAVTLSLVDSLSTGIVKGYLINKILADLESGSARQPLPGQRSADLPVVFFRSGRKTGKRPDFPEQAGAFALSPSLEKIQLPGEAGLGDGARHHIISQAHMQLLHSYVFETDSAYANYQNVFRTLLGVKDDSAKVALGEWVWAPFNWFVGPKPNTRSDDFGGNQPESLPNSVLEQGAHWQYLAEAVQAITPCKFSDKELKLNEKQKEKAVATEAKAVIQCLQALEKLANTPGADFSERQYQVDDWRREESAKFRLAASPSSAPATAVANP
ncbi:MAG: serine protease [Pseudomonadota bacterium]